MQTKITALVLTLCLFFSLAACGQAAVQKELWDTALYTEDASFGEGATTVTVTVTAGDRSVNFTLHTDEAILGDALLAHGLIDGEEGPYGLYVKYVNGIRADYDSDQAYWSLEQDGAPLPSGVDTTEIFEGASYALVYRR